MFDITTLYYNAQIIVHQLAFRQYANTEKLLRICNLKDQLGKGSDVSKVKLQAEQLNTQRQQQQTYSGFECKLNMNLLRILLSSEPARVSLESNTRNVLELKIIQKQNQLFHSDLKTLNQSDFYFVKLIALRNNWFWL